MMIFAIVTPCFNPGSYLLETLQSVVSQAGDFSIHYHIQDAQSTDGTIDILESLTQAIRCGILSIQCKELTFSYASEPDRGMYDAINRGFREIINRTDPDLMLWINADDMLDKQALSNVASFFRSNLDVDWIIGRTIHLNEDSEITIDIPPHHYKSENLVAGYHNGEILPFVTQEATCWRTTVWKKTGMLNPRLRYAGDFEYWCRVASQFNLTSVDMRIGFHRKTKGQLSSIGGYQEEILLLKNHSIQTGYEETTHGFE